MEYKILTLADKDQWNKYLKEIPLNQQDVYYTPEYYSLYQNLGDGEAKCFVFKENGKIALYPFLLNSVNELGYNLDDEYYDIQGAYGYNGIISSSYCQNFIEDFFACFDNFCCQNNIIAEFTRFHPLIGNIHFSNSSMQILNDRITVKVDLEKHGTIDQVWAESYNKQLRKDCRHALRQNLNYTIGEDIESYRKFYKLYLELMLEINSDKYYHFKESFFEDICINLKGISELILIWLNEELVGGFIWLYYGIYSNNFLSAGSFAKRNLNINDFMQDICIKRALRANIKLLNLGGGNSNSPEDPLFKYKSKFSRDYCLFYIGKKIHKADVYNEIINQWVKKNPDTKVKYQNMLLKYRY